MPDVVESPSPGAFDIGVTNRTAERRFSIIAFDRVIAGNKLFATGVRIDTVYQTNGQIPSPFLKATGIRISPVGRELLGDPDNEYMAVVKYETSRNGNKEDRQGLELIPDGPVHFFSESSLSDIPQDHDVDGNPIVNSAGVPYDPPLSFPRPSQFIIAEYIDSGTQWEQAEIFTRQFRGKVNSATWKQLLPGNSLCHSFLPLALDNDAFSTGGLVKFTARFETRDRLAVKSLGVNILAPGFHQAKLDTGRQELNDDGELIAITDVNQDGKRVQVSNDVLLDGAGKRILPGGLVQSVANIFDGIPGANFNQLRI